MAGTFDRVASLWFVASCLVLQPGNNACSIMYGQKPLLRRELSNGLYHYSSFFVAKSLTSLPFQAMFAALFNTAVYFLARWPHPRCVRAGTALIGPRCGAEVLEMEQVVRLPHVLSDRLVARWLRTW